MNIHQQEENFNFAGNRGMFIVGWSIRDLLSQKRYRKSHSRVISDKVMYNFLLSRENQDLNNQNASRVNHQTFVVPNMTQRVIFRIFQLNLIYEVLSLKFKNVQHNFCEFLPNLAQRPPNG